MKLDQEDIENIIKISCKKNNLDEFLAPQELQRIAEVLYQILNSRTDLSVSQDFNFIAWSEIVKQQIQKGLESIQDVLGIKDFYLKFDAEEFLKQFYYFESGMFLKK